MPICTNLVYSGSVIGSEVGSKIGTLGIETGSANLASFMPSKTGWCLAALSSRTKKLVSWHWWRKDKNSLSWHSYVSPRVIHYTNFTQTDCQWELHSIWHGHSRTDYSYEPHINRLLLLPTNYVVLGKLSFPPGVIVVYHSYQILASNEPRTIDHVMTQRPSDLALKE